MPKILSATPITQSGLSKDAAEAVFDQITQFAGYGFNKSHAAAYAAISYQTAYLRQHHPQAFFSALLNACGDTKETAKNLHEIKIRNITILPPDINRSHMGFVPENLQNGKTGIRYGLSSIHGVGTQVSKDIVEERKARGLFKNAQDFSERLNGRVAKNVAVVLANAGAFDNVEPHRAAARSALENARKNGAQIGFLDMLDVDSKDNGVPADSVVTTCELEHQALGLYLTQHPLSLYGHVLKQRKVSFVDHVKSKGGGEGIFDVIAVVEDGHARRTKNGNTLGIVTLSDPTGVYEALAFSDVWNAHAATLGKKRQRVKLRIKAEGEPGFENFVILGVTPFEQTA